MIETINVYNQPTEYRGLSSDKKPNSDFVHNGDVFLEMDTCKVFMYDKSTQTWIELK